MKKISLINTLKKTFKTKKISNKKKKTKIIKKQKIANNSSNIKKTPKSNSNYIVSFRMIKRL